MHGTVPTMMTTLAVKKVKEAATLIWAQIREMEYSNESILTSSDLYLEKC